LIAVAADDGEDKRLIAEGNMLAKKWLDDRNAIEPDMVGTTLRVAAQSGDPTLWDRLHAAAQKEKDRNQRGRLLRAMSSFRAQPVVERALAVVLTSEFELPEAMRLVWGALGQSETRQLAYDFVKKNFDELAKKLPRESIAGLAYTGAGFCDAEHRKDVESFFRGRSTKYPGGPRDLEQALEQIDLCIAFSNLQRPSVATFLKKY
jgi:alanyl aminopeptidase